MLTLPIDEDGPDDDLSGLVEGFSRLEEAVEADPMAAVELTLAQLAWVWMAGPRLLWRGANQIGKSFGLAYKLLCYILRRGPYANRKIGPVRALVLSTSKEQMIPLMEKLWGMLPKGEVCRSARKKNGRSVIEPLEFIDGFGFAGKVPRIYFHSGPGVGSLVQFATYKQGAGRIAGGTFDIVLLDEPPPEKVWGEVMPRVMSKGGDVWVGFTPTPDSPDLKYMRKLVKIEGEKQGQGVKELHTPLTVEAMTLPATNYRPLRYLKTQAQIDAYAASIIPAEADMRVRGGWDIVVTERWFMGWGPSCLMPANEAPPPEAILCISGDHGTKPGRQAFAFLAIAEPQSLCPRVWLLNCYQPTTANDSEQDAEGILTMLAETGKRYGIHIGYDHIQHWIADRATAYNEQGVRKSNSRLKRYLAQKLRRDEAALKEIHTPIKYDRSVSDGQTMLNNIMGARQPDGRSNFRAWEGAEAFINSVQTYQGGKNEPAKDMMDAVRYGVEHVCRTQGRTGSVIYS